MMLGIIFIMFFFVLGTFEFFGHSNEQLALSLYLISAIFYVGYAIYFNGAIKSQTSKAWSEAIASLSRIAKANKNATEKETNN